jgi:Tol biopolymer transport system component
VTFIRGPATFFGPGEVYVKRLPDGEPVQLTNDSLAKMGPVFSPDGTRIAYTAIGRDFEWDTWVVPVVGGSPRLWLRNASGLAWSNAGHVLFSEIKNIPHMGIVAAEENRVGAHDVYLPAHEHAMAHRSYASPDGKWVLVVEMNMDHAWMPCRLLPVDGSSSGRQVGPSRAACTSGAWSPDGQWMYVTSNAGGVHHIWRQRFPDGQPEQVTSGPTEEQGIAMAPDGRSFVTALALQNLSIWLHDARGDRQISSLEGIAANPKFTADGKKLCYTIVKEVPTAFSAQPGEIWVADTESGRSESLVPGFRALDYDISPDGQQVVMEASDAEGRHRLWLASFDHQSAPREITSVEGRQPRFGPGGEIFFRRDEQNSNFAYSMRADGSGIRKVLEHSLPLLFGVSHDGRWILGWAALPNNDGMAVQAFSLSGAPTVTLGDFITWNWSADGESLSVSDGPIAANRSYIIPLAPSEAFPKTPTEGFRSEEEIASITGARRIDALTVPGASPGVYAFYRGTTQRNLYRIAVP